MSSYLYQGLQSISLDIKKVKRFTVSCEIHRVKPNAGTFGDSEKLIGSQDTKFMCQRALNPPALLMSRRLDAARRSVKINRATSVKVTSDREINGRHKTTIQFRHLAK